MPSASKHLVLRVSTWHCRIDIPADLRPAFGNRRILSQSLKTGDKRLANELASMQIGQWKSEFRRLREERIRQGDRWQEGLAKKAKEHLEQADVEILRAVRGTLIPSNRPKPTVESVERDQEALGSAYQSLYNDVYRMEQELGIPGLLDEVDSLLNDETLPTPTKFQRFSEIQQRVLAHSVKAKNLLPASGLAEALQIATAPETYRPKSPMSASAQSRFAIHLAEQNANARTNDVYLSNIKRFSTWLSTNGKELVFDHVAEYLNSVSKVRQTRLGHLAALRKFHKWAVRYDQYYREQQAERRSPFDGHEHPRVGAKAGTSWVAYTQQEAERLHAAATTKGDADLADLIAFACFTGCRIEELGRIRVDTTIFDADGTPTGFKVDQSKTPSGVREVPLHPRLIPIYQKRLKDPLGVTRALFPGNDKTKHGLRISALSQRFTKLKRSEGFGDQHVFHSFRKCTATMLQQAGVTPLTIPFLLGHDVGNVTFDVYSAGPSFEQKREAIATLEFDF